MKVTIVPCMRDGWVVSEYGGEPTPTTIIAIRIEDDDENSVSDSVLEFERLPKSYALTSDNPDEWVKVGAFGCAVKTDPRVCLSEKDAIDICRSRSSEKYQELLEG